MLEVPFLEFLRRGAVRAKSIYGCACREKVKG
jgi:hypothetical protein